MAEGGGPRFEHVSVWLLLTELTMATLRQPDFLYAPCTMTEKVKEGEREVWSTNTINS